MSQTEPHNRIPIPYALYDSIERTLGQRTTEPDTQARAVEDFVKQSSGAAWNALSVALAEAVGAAELAFGVATAHAAFRVLRRGEAPEKAVGEVLHR